MSATYEEILKRMQDKFEQEAGFPADDASDIGIRLKVLAGEIYSACTNIDWLKQQVFPQTAIGEYLDYHAQERGINRKEAIKATGTLTFFRNEALQGDIKIDKGTRCCTSLADGIQVETVEDAILADGVNSIDIKACAVNGGINGNLAAGTVTILVSQVPGVNSVINNEAFVGGYDMESDEELRERIVESYKNISNGTNASFYEAHALSYEDVYSASAVAMAQGVGTVDVYVAGHGSSCSAELMQEIEDELNKLREINVKVEVKAPTEVIVDVIADISIDSSYQAAQVIESCEKAIEEYFKSLKIGESALLADIGEVIYHTDGVTNYAFDRVSCSDIKTSNTELAVLRTITLSEAE